MRRALKILKPDSDLVDRPERLDAFRQTFVAEVGYLARLSHPNIATITDAGELTIRGLRYPYYAAEFIDGTRFHESAEKLSLDARTFLMLFDQVLAGIEYMHSQGVMHCDLKSDNVLVRKLVADQFAATIVDLGVAKNVVPEGSERATGVGYFMGHTFFHTSPKITHPCWQRRIGKRISLEQVRAMFPTHDLYSLGKLLESSLESSGRLAAQLERELGRSGFRSLQRVIDELTSNPSRKDYEYRTASQLRRAWRKLAPGYVAPLEIPELAPASQAKTSIAVPTGRVAVTARVYETVNHPLVQRLRMLPQLELVSLVFPGATHTRLLHSLTTFDTCRRYIGHLLGDPAFRMLVDRHEVEATLLTALLHDIGHFPLSHMFEDFARVGGGPLDIPTDDDLFWCFLDPESPAAQRFPQYTDAIRRACKKYEIQPLHEFLFEGEGRLFDVGVREALGTLAKPSTVNARVLAGVIHSPVDVHKVSYLIDDSTMSGVRYGVGIDLDALLSALRAPDPRDLNGHYQGPILAISDKGLPAAEAVIAARYWMIKRVYWHHTNRSTMAMLKFVIWTLLTENRFELPEYFSQQLFGSAWGALEYLSKQFDKAHSDRVNPLRGLLHGRRDIYKRLVSVTREADADYRALYDAMTSLDFDEARHVAHRAVESAIGEPLRPGEVLIDAPVPERELIGDELRVYLPWNETGLSIRRRAVSPLVASLGAEFDRHVKKCRVFVAPHIANKAKERRAEIIERLIEDFAEAGSQRQAASSRRKRSARTAS